MAHFAKVVDGIVEQVIVADNKQWCEATYGGTWVQTSYNTFGDKYIIEGQTEIELVENPNWVEVQYPEIPKEPRYFEKVVPKKPLHKNYAGIGYTWDGTGFAAPEPYASWTLDADTYLWSAPTPMPTDDKRYRWDEPTLTWVEITLSA